MAFSIFGLDIQRRNNRVVLGNQNVTYAEFIDALGAGKSAADITVTDRNAMTLSAVYAAVKILSETIAELPLDRYKRTDNGKERIDDDLSYMLSTAPSPLYTSYQFRIAMQACVSIYGNAYAAIDREVSGKLKALTIIDPTKVEVKQIETTGEILYVVDGKAPLESWQMLHIKGLSFDGIVGMSPLAYHKEAIANGLAMQEFSNKFFGNGSLMSGVITRPGTMTKEAATALRQEWDKAYRGRSNQMKVAILDAGMSFEKISVTPEEAQFLASRQFNVQDIARVYRIPAHMLGDLSRSTNNNIEQQSLEFVQYTMLPIIKNWEQELDRKLIKNKQEFFKFNVNALMRGDSKSRAEYYVKMLQNGVMSPNEIRELENMNKREGGDIYLVPMNLTTNPEDAYGQGKEDI